MSYERCVVVLSSKDQSDLDFICTDLSSMSVQILLYPTKMDAVVLPTRCDEQVMSHEAEHLERNAVLSLQPPRERRTLAD